MLHIIYFMLPSSCYPVIKKIEKLQTFLCLHIFILKSDIC